MPAVIESMRRKTLDLVIFHPKNHHHHHHLRKEKPRTNHSIFSHHNHHQHNRLQSLSFPWKNDKQEKKDGKKHQIMIMI